MQFTYYGHSCFSVSLQNKILLFDPFISENPIAGNLSPDHLHADYILVSHGHQDHILDAEAIALRTGAKVICSWEIHEWLQAKGVANTHPMNVGGKWIFDDFTVKCVVAQHSSSLPDGSYGGNPMGFIIYSEAHSFYYSGDTALTMDMQLIPRWADISFAILPIGDNFTMGMEDAALAADFVKTKTVIGVHFDTFGYIKIDHAIAKETFTNAGIMLHLLHIGESIHL
jgi:L-ascorbate metabolism protein UlaG (beta-lactamase superfamily)